MDTHVSAVIVRITGAFIFRWRPDAMLNAAIAPVVMTVSMKRDLE